MRTDTILKGLAVATWSIALALFVLGLVEKQDPLDLYAFGSLMTLLAMTFTGILVVDNVVARQWAKARVCLASSIARALADELEQRQESSSVTRIR